MLSENDKPLMPSELARLVGCCRSVIDKELRRGTIPHVKLGRRIFIPRRVANEILHNGRIPQLVESCP